jgi:hypothetical protein
MNIELVDDGDDDMDMEAVDDDIFDIYFGGGGGGGGGGGAEPYEPIRRQPTEGRNRDGGVRDPSSMWDFHDEPYILFQPYRHTITQSMGRINRKPSTSKAVIIYEPCKSFMQLIDK